jgi:LDH2 family malate/lactate/ureidoglycolate dehydrogenase
MATAKRAWGQIRLANKYGTDLPADTFYDAKGNTTLNPSEAESVKSFGEYKGFSLALLVEILNGSLVGMNMMTPNETGGKFGDKLSERGGLIIVIDPSKTTDLESFKAANSKLVEDILTTTPLEGQTIRIPGYEAGKLQARRKQKGEIDIPDELWQEISEL